MPYILEVQKFYPDGHILHPEWNGKSEHIGYMNKIFPTKQMACIIMMIIINICVL